MASLLDSVLNIPGASGWLGQLLGGLNNQDPLLGSMNTGGYTNSGQTAAPASFADRFNPALTSPLGPAPLPPPVNIPSLNVAQPQQDQGLPQAAQPIQYQPQPAPPPVQLPTDTSPAIGDRLSSGFQGFADRFEVLRGVLA